MTRLDVSYQSPASAMPNSSDRKPSPPEQCGWNMNASGKYCPPAPPPPSTSPPSSHHDHQASHHYSHSTYPDSYSSIATDSTEPKRSYSACALGSDSEFTMGFLERKPYRPFRSNEEYLVAMKEDLAEWLNTLYTIEITADDFLAKLETGVILCRHANSVLRKAREWRMLNGYSPFKQISLLDLDLDRDVPVKPNALAGTFQARDNVANFIEWCRRIRIHECLLFETEDLVARKNEKSFVLCLLEVARYGAKFGLLAPTLVQFEQEIDKELEKEQQQKEEQQDVCLYDSTPQQQITNNDLESLHEKVVNLLSRCTCPIQFYLEHLSEGKYRIGDTKTLIFVRILRNHVMVRVGGGWDTLEHYLEKHDPCRCRFGKCHRFTGGSAARVSLSYNHQKSSPQQMQVTYARLDSRKSPPANSSPVAPRRIIRPNSVTHNLSSMADHRRASTSSNDSASSLSSASLAPTPDKCDSLLSSEHSSLSSHNSLNGHFALPDRNNNIKGAKFTPKPTLAKKRGLDQPTPFTRIPKSKSSNIAAHSKGTSPTPSSAPITGSVNRLTPAHRLKSNSSLAIAQLGTSKIPCLDSTNRTRVNGIGLGKIPGHLPTRYSTHNLYMASQTTGQERLRRALVQNNGFGTAAAKTKTNRTTNLNRMKQKSTIDVSSNENHYLSLRPMESALAQVPKDTPKKQPGPQPASVYQHRRHYSSSSLPRLTTSSPFAKRRELNQTKPVNGTKPEVHKVPLHFQGSASSLNSTASTISSNGSLGPEPEPTTKANPPIPLAKTDKRPSALVEVCSWLERNHMAS